MLREVRAGVSEGWKGQGTQMRGGEVGGYVFGVSGEVKTSLAGALAWAEAGRWGEQGMVRSDPPSVIGA